MDKSDLIVGDRDGVIFIFQTIAEEVVKTENLVGVAILKGVLPLEAY